MYSFNKHEYDLLNLNYKFMTSFIEVCKPFMKESDYEFYNRVIDDIDFNHLIINVDNYVNFLIEKNFTRDH